MTTDTYRCPCGSQLTVRLRDHAQHYLAEFHDDQEREVSECKCGNPLYEMLAAGRLREMPEPAR